jgi:N utilization substance protein B
MHELIGKAELRLCASVRTTGVAVSAINRPAINRRPARVIALQALYELDVTQHSVADVLTARMEEVTVDTNLHSFTYMIVNGVVDNRTQIDAIIQTSASEWPLDQVSVVDRNILRLAVYELAAVRDIPVNVIINEAVDLAKDFGSESTARFINGVLGALSINMLAVAGPKRMVKWAYDFGRITAKVRGMFQETMEAFKRELEESDPELAKDLRGLPNIVKPGARFDIVKEANKLVGETINTPVNSKYSSSTTGSASATTMTTTNTNANATANDNSVASTQSDDEQSRYDAWTQK